MMSADAAQVPVTSVLTDVTVKKIQRALSFVLEQKVRSALACLG